VRGRKGRKGRREKMRWVAAAGAPGGWLAGRPGALLLQAGSGGGVGVSRGTCQMLKRKTRKRGALAARQQ
jgi:hypothetical protein